MNEVGSGPSTPRPVPPSRSGPLTTQLLIDLATSPLDAGYAAAAARRRGGPAPRRFRDRLAVAVGCALIGFVLVVAYVHTHRGAPQAAKVHDSLVSRVRAAEHDSDALAARAQKLNSQLNTLRDSALSGGDLSAQIDRSQLLAGDIAVSGPGLEVQLREPPLPTSTPTNARGGSVPVSATNILTDRDVRSVVNELWIDGAEAISVNNIRLTPTSAIRFAGQAVLVDFQPITSPYVIRALGNRDDLATSFASSAVAGRYQTLVSADGIGFGFTEHSSLALPAGSSVALRYAHAPMLPPSTTPSPGASR